MVDVASTDQVPRRSTRVRNEVSYKDQDDGIREEARPAQARSAKRPRPGSSAGTQSSSGGKATYSTENGGEPSPDPPVDLHHVFRLPPDDAEEYEGWVELESDPAQFNYIVHSLGVSGVRFEEVLTMDESEVDLLNHPICGFIFLFDCEDVPRSDDTTEAPTGMWFAGQTIANSCATVAILNVLMNAGSIDLGGKLEKFKEETADMCISHRGVLMAQDVFLRATHNTFARRLDLMDEDLCVMNNYDDRNKRSSSKAKSNKRKRKAVDPNSAKHYIAYVPYEGKLWELDGLEAGVVCMGPYEGEWTTAVLPLIRERAIALGLQANLLALCHSPLAKLRQDLVENAASLVYLQRRLDMHPQWDITLEEHSHWVDASNPEHATALAELGLTPEEVMAAVPPTAASPECGDGSDGQEMTEDEARLAARRLCESHRELRREYDRERSMVDEDLRTARRRRQDYTPLVHSWVQTMCEAGMLDALSEAF